MQNIEFVGKCLLVGAGAKKILAVGDLHLGYEEYLNRSGVFVSRQMFNEMISYFDKIFKKIGRIDEVVLLGDVKHDFGNILRQERDDVLKLLDYFSKKCTKIIIVKGNHDNILEPIVRKRKNVKLRNFYVAGEICFAHGNREFEEMLNKKIKVLVAGHGHPAVKISDGVKIEKYKCFLAGKFKGKEIVIAPSFSEYNEGSDPRENDLGLFWKFNFKKFNVFVVQEKDFNVLNFGSLGKL